MWEGVADMVALHVTIHSIMRDYVFPCSPLPDIVTKKPRLDVGASPQLVASQSKQDELVVSESETKGTLRATL